MRILFLAHRIPFPPNKGDKIRSFHEIVHLSKKHEIHLLAFCDDTKDYEHAQALRSYCKDVTLIALKRQRQWIQAIAAMLSGSPWSIGYFSNPLMKAAVHEKLSRNDFDAAIVFSSSVAPYLASTGRLPRIIDFVDSDASKWRQYARFKPFPAGWLYFYEGKKLARFEEQMLAAFDSSVFITSREVRYLAVSTVREKIHIVQNGVEIDRFFVPRGGRGADTLIFTGAMDYFPNVDAVTFFAREVMPLVRMEHPGAEFLIVGSRPARAVRRLAALPGVKVTGTVPDVRPFLASAKVAVVPVRISQGMQNKILEALAAGLPVVTTSAAAEGLPNAESLPIAIAEDARSCADHVINFLQKPLQPEQIATCHDVLRQHYDWDRNLAAFDRLLESIVHHPRSAGRAADYPASY